MSQPELIEKIRALLTSPVEAEREAAKEALARKGAGLAVIPSPKIQAQPATGSPEYFDALNEWSRKLVFCQSRLGSPLLSDNEIATIRNWVRGRGYPWETGADLMLDIYEKLLNAERAKING